MNTFSELNIKICLKKWIKDVLLYLTLTVKAFTSGVSSFLDI